MPCLAAPCRAWAGRLQSMTRERQQVEGCVADYGTLVAAEIPRLYRYALSITGDRSEAEDVVGDTVVRALERRGQFRGEASLGTWLHKILYHLAIDRARHDSREVSVEEVESLWRDGDYSVDAAVVAETAASAERLRDTLVHLPPHYRSVVVLHDAETWSVREVAALAHISIPAAKQRLRRGRMMLVTALGREAELRVANKGVPLTCWEARKEVSDYLDNEVGSKERAVLEAHFARCASCPALYQALVGVTASLGTLRDPDTVIPIDLIKRIQAREILR